MKNKMGTNMIQKAGSIAFIVGLIIAIIAGFWPLGTVMTAILIILGLIVGFLNITGKEVNNFLFATLVLVVMSTMGGQLLANIPFIGQVLQNMFSAMVSFIAPAAIIVALKSIYSLAEAE